MQKETKVRRELQDQKAIQDQWVPLDPLVLGALMARQDQPEAKAQLEQLAQRVKQEFKVRLVQQARRAIQEPQVLQEQMGYEELMELLNRWTYRSHRRTGFCGRNWTYRRGIHSGRPHGCYWKQRICWCYWSDRANWRDWRI